MRCKLECEILVHKTARIAKIIVNIGKVCETHNLNEEDLPASLRAILRSLVRTGELDRIEHVFKECSQRTKKFLLRAHLLTKIKQCDVELSNVLQAFQAELALDTRFALVVQRREATVDPGPDEAISYNSLEGSPLTPAQPRQYLEPLYLSIFFVFLCVAFFEPVTAIPLGPKSFVFIVGITLIVVWFVGQSRPLPTPVNNTSPLPRRPPLSLPSSSAKQK
ncbi:hypothetical protein EDB83DRAFT_1403106 [Lactarius deliciosus]|nr:hypothetical protein EDB83DRAFT_1403106 [Lactarius deliciosus]